MRHAERNGTERGKRCHVAEAAQRVWGRGWQSLPCYRASGGRELSGDLLPVAAWHRQTAGNGNGVREGAGPAGLSPTRSEHLPAQTSQRVHGLRVAERGNPLSLQPPEVGSCERLVGSDARWPHTGNSVGKSSFPVKFKSAQPQWRAPRVLRCRASGHRQVPIPQGTLPEPGFRASTTRFAQSPDDRHCH